jgi:hypothetical protein
MAKLPRLAILEFKSAPESWSGWRAGGWGPQMGTISNQLRDLFTTELVEQGAGKVRLMDRERLEALRDEGAVENASVKFLGAGVDIPYDGELVNKVFEPVVQRLAPRLVAAIQRHHAMPQE